MQSLRDRQKLQRRTDMLNAARDLFVERGYSKTTMDAVAEHAGVGVATVYSYFTNKEGVFAELAHMDMSELNSQGEASLQRSPSDPVEAVLNLIDIYAKVHDYISYEVLVDFTIGAKTQGPLQQVADWVSDWRVAQLTTALSKAQKAGRLAPRLAVRDAARIICDLVDRYYDRTTSPESDRKALSTLKRCVRLLFDDWRASPK
jgi:AcrR family transcriptional regulator